MTIPNNLRQMTEDQLWQRLKDIEAEQGYIREEIRRRLDEQHPILSPAIREATRKALST